MDTEELLRESQQLAAEVAESSAAAESQPVDIRVLGEGVSAMLTELRATDERNNKTLDQMNRVLVEVEKTPASMKQAVILGYQETLAKMEKEQDERYWELESKESELEQRIAEANKRDKRWFYGLIGFGMLISGGAAAASTFYLKPEIKELKEYEESHQILKVGAVYGVHQFVQEGREFISLPDLDRNVEIRQLKCTDGEVCLEIIRP